MHSSLDNAALALLDLPLVSSTTGFGSNSDKNIPPVKVFLFWKSTQTKDPGFISVEDMAAFCAIKTGYKFIIWCASFCLSLALSFLWEIRRDGQRGMYLRYSHPQLS